MCPNAFVNTDEHPELLQDPVKVASTVCRGTFTSLHCWCIQSQVNHVLLASCAASIRTLPCYLTRWFPRFDPACSWCACSVPDLVNWSSFRLTKSQLAPRLLLVAWLLLVLRCIHLWELLICGIISWIAGTKYSFVNWNSSCIKIDLLVDLCPGGSVSCFQSV